MQETTTLLFQKVTQHNSVIIKASTRWNFFNMYITGRISGEHISSKRHFENRPEQAGQVHL